MSVMAIFLGQLGHGRSNGTGRIGGLLDDDVLGAVDDADTLALDDTRGALADQTLVGLDGNAQHTGSVAARLLARAVASNARRPKRTR